MNYSQALEYLFNQLPMFSRIGAAAYKKDLTNTIALCAHFGNPQNNFPTVHIAGTNGKGSTSHLLAAALQTAGYRVGLYTSPHYIDFKERIKIDGLPVTEAFVTQFTADVQALADQIKPSFFEITVAMAFAYFSAQKVDIAIIETGLGGRLDSTNIVQPLLSVITNIDYDHMDMLGDTLALIAGEKAGIIKPNTPALIGESHPETTQVFVDKATSVNAELFFAEDFIKITHKGQNLEHAFYHIENRLSDSRYNLSLQLLGNYQSKNLATVTASLALLAQKTPFRVSEEQFKIACAQVQTLTGMLGRWQVLGKKPLMIADAAHNPHGLGYVLEQLKDVFKTYQLQKLHFIFGCVKDKDVSKILSLLPQNAQYYFCNAQIPRAMPADVLKDKAAEFGLLGNHFDSIKQALQNAKTNCKDDEMIFIGGSIFVIGEALLVVND